MTMSINDDRFSTHDARDDETLADAEREAELARASFSASVRTASQSGVHVVKKVAQSAKPILIGALVVGGAAVLVAAAKVGRRPRTVEWAKPARRKRGLLGTLVRMAATRLVVMGATRLAERYLAPRLQPHIEDPSPEPAIGVPR